MRRVFIVWLVAVVSLSWPMCNTVFAADPTSEQLLQRIEQLEKRIADLEAAQSQGKTVQSETISGETQVPETRTPETQPPLAKLLGEVALGGFIDVSYGYNFNNLDITKEGNILRVFDLDNNTFELNLLKIYAEKPALNPGDAGFRFDLAYGRTAELINIEPNDASFGDPLALEQVYVTYKAPIGNGLDIAFGKFVTFLGAEVIESKDNPNFSRSFLFGFAIPFTHTGLKLSYPFTEKVSYSQYIVNGWDNVIDNNNCKSLGGQLLLAPVEPLSFAFNWIYGAEQPDNESDKRALIDLVSTYQAMDSLKFVLNYDYGTEEHAALDGGNAHWQGFAGIIEYDLTEKLALACRGEWFSDDGGSRTGIDQDLYEATLTATYHLTDHLMTRLEYRHDWSTEDPFYKDDRYTDRQDTIFFDAVYVF